MTAEQKLLDDDGKPFPLKGTPRYVEIEVQDLVIKEAIAFRAERDYAEDGSYYYNYKKQPYVHLQVRKPTYGNRRQLYITDRKVVWDLIRSFDPEITYFDFLRLLDEFSLHQMLEDFFHDYNGETIGVYFQHSRSKDNTSALKYVVVGVERRTGINAEDLGFQEVEEYIMSKVNLSKAHHRECFMEVLPKAHRNRKKAVVRYKIPSQQGLLHAGQYTLEIILVCGTPYDTTKRGPNHSSLVQGNTQMRLFLDSQRGRVQVMPVVHWAKQLEFVESEKLYSQIDKAIEIITGKVFRVLPGKNFADKWTLSMTPNEWDSIQYQNFLNYFIESE